MPEDSKEIESLRTNLLKNLLSAELIKVPPFYHDIVFEILIKNKTYAQVAQIHGISQQKVEMLFMKSYKRINEGIGDLRHLLAQFKEILHKTDLAETEATLYNRGLITEKNFIESFGLEYTPELAVKLALRIADCNLEERIKNLCRVREIQTIRELIMTGRKKFSYTRRCGTRTMETLDRFLDSMGLFWLA